MKKTRLFLLCAAASLMLGITAYGGSAGNGAAKLAARTNTGTKAVKNSDPGDSVNGRDLVFKTEDKTHTKVYDYDHKIILIYPDEMEYVDIFPDAVTATDTLSNSFVVCREVTDLWLHYNGDDASFMRMYYKKYILSDFDQLYGDGTTPEADDLVFKNDNGKYEALSSMTGELENKWEEVDVAAALYQRTHKSTGENVYLVRTVFSPSDENLRRYYWWETNVKGCKR